MTGFFQKYKLLILAVTVVAFMFVIVAGVIPYLFMPKGKDYAIKVNGVAIDRKRCETWADFIRTKRGMEVDANSDQKNFDDMKMSVIGYLVSEEIFCQEAERYGIRVTDAELRAYLRSLDVFKRSGVFEEIKYRGYLANMQINPKEFELGQRRQLIGRKVKNLISSCVVLWNYEFEEAAKQNLSVTKKSLLDSKKQRVLGDWVAFVRENAKIVFDF